MTAPEPSTRSRDGSPGWRETRGATLLTALLLLVSLAVSGALAEWTLRFAPPHFGHFRALVVEDPVTSYALAPGAEVHFAGMYERLPAPVIWQVNDQGFRSDRNVGPPDDLFRIATYGDSETFGWSVDLEDTFQRRMEEIDPRIEVLNFGVPGYNIESIADHVERTLPAFAPDLAIYLVHKNDFDDRLEVSRFVADSQLLMRLRFLYHFTAGKPQRIARRHSGERARAFSSGVERMIRLFSERDVPLVVGFLKWRNRAALGDLHPEPVIIDVQEIVQPFPRIDAHLTPPAYQALGRRICHAISGGTAGCMPRYWARAKGPSLAARER